MGLAIGKSRAAKAAESEEYQSFWRDHGREWAEREADVVSLERVAGMVAGAPPSRKERAAAIELAMKDIWAKGFSNTQEAYGWDEMGDELPSAALVAFADGAYDAWLQAGKTR